MRRRQTWGGISIRRITAAATTTEWFEVAALSNLQGVDKASDLARMKQTALRLVFTVPLRLLLRISTSTSPLYVLDSSRDARAAATATATAIRMATTPRTPPDSLRPPWSTAPPAKAGAVRLLKQRRHPRQSRRRRSRREIWRSKSGKEGTRSSAGVTLKGLSRATRGTAGCQGDEWGGGGYLTAS